MGEFLRGLVGPQNVSDGSGSLFRAGRTGEIIIGAGHGGYYEAVKRGRVFVGSNAITGLAIPIYSAKANALTLWNPTGNNFDLVLLATILGHHSTTGLMGVVCYGTIIPAGANIGTAAPFPTATLADPVNALLGQGMKSTALFSPAVNTTTATPAQLMPFCSVLPVTSAQTVQPYQVIDYVDGRIVIAPGSAIQLLGSTAVAIVAQQTFVWEEVPI